MPTCSYSFLRAFETERSSARAAYAHENSMIHTSHINIAVLRLVYIFKKKLNKAIPVRTDFKGKVFLVKNTFLLYALEFCLLLERSKQ